MTSINSWLRWQSAWHMYFGCTLDKISSRIFVTLRYRDEDPIVEKPGAVISANYASVTIISNQRKTYTYWKTLTLSIHIQKKVTLLKICANVYLIEFTNSQQHCMAAFKSKTDRVAQPITDAADTTGLGFATRPLTPSYYYYYYYYYYVTLTVSSIGNETVPKITLYFALRMTRSVKQHCARPVYRFDTVSCRIWCVVCWVVSDFKVIFYK